MSELHWRCHHTHKRGYEKHIPLPFLHNEAFWGNQGCSKAGLKMVWGTKKGRLALGFQGGWRWVSSENPSCGLKFSLTAKEGECDFLHSLSIFAAEGEEDGMKL